MDPIALLLLIIVAYFGLLIVTALSQRKGFRIAASVGVFISTLFLCFAATIFQKFQANSDFGGAAVVVAPACIAAIERGEVDKVVRALKEFESDYRPTYEQRRNFVVLANRLADRLKVDGGIDGANKKD